MSLRAVPGSAAVAALSLSPKPEFVISSLAGIIGEPTAGFYKDISRSRRRYMRASEQTNIAASSVSGPDNAAKAEEQVSALKQLCPGACEEFEGLRAVIAARTDNRGTGGIQAVVNERGLP